MAVCNGVCCVHARSILQLLLLPLLLGYSRELPRYRHAHACTRACCKLRWRCWGRFRPVGGADACQLSGSCSSSTADG